MQRHTLAALAASLAVIPSLAVAETRTLEVPSFHGVDTSSGIRAIISGGKPLSVVVDAKDARDLDELKYEVRDGVLHLWYDWSLGNIFDWSGREVIVTIGTEQLDDVEASAGANVEASNLLGEDFGLEATSGAFLKAMSIEGMFYEIESTSGARIKTSGRCSSAKIEVTTGASVAAKELDCSKIEVEVTTGASLEITARTVDVEVTTGGHATIFGKPGVDHLEASTGGSVDFPG